MDVRPLSQAVEELAKGHSAASFRGRAKSAVSQRQGQVALPLGAERATVQQQNACCELVFLFQLCFLIGVERCAAPRRWFWHIATHNTLLEQAVAQHT